MTRLPTLRQLQHFVALAEHLHFGRAAETVHATQSTLSASLKELEETLGAPLLERTKRSVALTPLGAEIARRARLLLADAEALAQTAGAARAPLSGPLRLGVIPTIGPFLLPRVLPALRRAYPRLQLFLLEDLTDRLVAGIRDGALDLAVLAKPYDLPGLDERVIAEDSFVFAAPKGHKLLSARKLDPAAIREANLLLLRDGHCLRDHALSACGVHAPRYDGAFEATSLMTLVQMVDSALGVTLLPQLAVDRGVLKGTHVLTRPLDSDAPKREIALVWRKSSLRVRDYDLVADAFLRHCS